MTKKMKEAFSLPKSSQEELEFLEKNGRGNNAYARASRAGIQDEKDHPGLGRAFFESTMRLQTDKLSTKKRLIATNLISLVVAFKLPRRRHREVPS
jgi:hypothetical protein